MPIHTGQDKNGKFYQWGKTGKKYYFKPEDKQSRQRALNKAKKQQTAIYSSGWKGDMMKLIKVKRGDTDPRKDLPADSRTNAQIKQRVSGYVKKVEALTQDITQFLSRQINVMNMELDFSSELHDVNKAMEKFEKKIGGLQ